MDNFGRYDYQFGALEESELPESPFEAFAVWIDDAASSTVVEPMAMNLATVGSDGRPSARMVLLRGFDQAGLRFFTNYGSRKGQELAANAFAALTFWWGPLERQIRVEGRVEFLPSIASDNYFDSRPLESRLASAASPQSEPVASRSDLEARVERLRQEFGESLRRPDNWGGYLLVPDRFEFWQGRPARLHDRIQYLKKGETWRRQRLAP